MTLDQELTAFRTEAERTAPAARVALYNDAADELRKRFPIDRARAVGDTAPDFTLPNVHGRPISLSKELGGGPAVVTFYRGGWCPYCNIQLRAYQRALPQIAATGGRLLAISPQLPDGSLTTVQKNELEFEVLSDARRLEPEEIIESLRSLR